MEDRESEGKTDILPACFNFIFIYLVYVIISAVWKLHIFIGFLQTAHAFQTRDSGWSDLRHFNGPLGFYHLDIHPLLWDLAKAALVIKLISHQINLSAFHIVLEF